MASGQPGLHVRCLMTGSRLIWCGRLLIGAPAAGKDRLWVWEGVAVGEAGAGPSACRVFDMAACARPRHNAGTTHTHAVCIHARTSRATLFALHRATQLAACQVVRPLCTLRACTTLGPAPVAPRACTCIACPPVLVLLTPDRHRNTLLITGRACGATVRNNANSARGRHPGRFIYNFIRLTVCAHDRRPRVRFSRTAGPARRHAWGASVSSGS